MNQGPKNLISDVKGVLVGNASDAEAKTGVTVVLCEAPAVASVHVMGGSPGTRETDLLAPEQTVEAIDAVVLSGGSAFGLDAAGSVMTGLARAGRGFLAAGVRVPLVPAAILFDLANGGDKDWGEEAPYPRLGAEALAAAGRGFTLGSVGAGTGATTANLKGGLGSASATLPGGITVGALIAVNALGQATMADGPHFWAAPFEVDGEFGGLGWPPGLTPDVVRLRHKAQASRREATTIGVVATDASLTKSEAKRLAIMAHDGLARALWPSHTPYDGDLVFALATGRVPRGEAPDLVALGATAAACMSRAIARGVYEATPAPGDRVPTWRQRFGPSAGGGD
ncbi:MAG TPA: P1 family peptidase [Bauldia sp.]|nr:P1 family peptidase [Bauldia sp.]